MKTRFSTVLFLICMVLVSSCKKEEVEEPLTETEPVFRADGTIGSDTFSLVAGKDNFYMNTMSENIDGVDYYYGSLSDGVTELEMGVYAGNIDMPSTSITQSIPEYTSLAMNPMQPLVYLSKDLFPNNMLMQEIQWFVDGSFKGVNAITLNNPGKFNVCAVVTFTDGSTDTLCNEMIVGYSKNAIGQIRHMLTANGNLQTWVEEDQVPVQSIKWFVDGVFVTDANKLAQNINQESHLITAEISFSNGVQRTKSVLIDGSNNGYFIDDFSYFESDLISFHWDFKTCIALKINGKSYHSKNAPNQTSEVHITNISYYGVNSSGKAVFKVSADVSCNLREDLSNEVLPFSCSTVFGVEIE
jgi:hypothetical protein